MKKIDKTTYMKLIYKRKMPFQDVAKKMGVSVSGLISFRRRNGLPVRGWSKPPWLGKKRSEDTKKNISKSKTGMFIGKDAWNFNGGYISGGYKLVYIGPGKYIQEHRLVMEQHIGRKLKKSENVHHINHNKLDNRIDNLIIMSNSEHAKLHYPPGSYFGSNAHRAR